MKSFNPAGYNIAEKGINLWTVQVINDTIYVGSFSEVVIYSIIRLGFKLEDIEFAVSTMLEEGHNVAHFGMNRTFLYSFQREKEDREKVSNG